MAYNQEPNQAPHILGSNYNTQYSTPTALPPTYASAVDPPPQKSYSSGVDPPPTNIPKNRIADSNYETGFADSPFGNSFSDKAVRHAFIRKVYLILMIQLLVTFGVVCLFSLVAPIKQFIQTTGSWFYWVSYGTFLVTYIVLVCIPSVRRKFPGNFICLAVFTLAFSYMVGTISSFYDTTIVFVAAGVTCLVCLALSLFAIQTKVDFTMCSGLLFALLMVLILFGWSCLIFYFVFPADVFAWRIMDCVYGGLAALVFSLFLVYDTQMVVGGKKHELSPEEYVYGALQLYIDIVYLFLILLACFGKSN
ncbi:protein lifeguard 2-like [Mytilus californianus]|uniref:protein lifeguard 2-like n=1 Tax=Mytilus californianus TaxID=6549 RepID=UPI0022481C68|nr:protein lifeguard 2-like [Mytilus californianus]XP_052093073.1 protein lifeguard 2-like [Mytilus californianus]XP_052093074.1 protein lifeguard 2-like [Mytilus californianus]XP_052093075.1 protein lifeguard 2-like [Mytilus californianus]XP_052093076.1 protein lifeguard 2-like [Mytilus californianus]XP_052093077.1 protein lifeguard 2-like [Mytilus californianus]